MAGEYRVRRLDQIEALASPVRLEILEALTTRISSTVAQVAEAIGRPADALYYHLRELVRVGLVLPAGAGTGGSRPEARYRAVARRVAVVYDPGSPGNVARVNRMAAALLRLGTRDFRKALRPGRVVVSGPRREIWVGRATGRLSATDLAKVNEILKRAAESFPPSGVPSGRRLYAVTFLLVPVGPPAPKSRRAGRRRAGSSKTAQ